MAGVGVGGDGVASPGTCSGEYHFPSEACHHPGPCATSLTPWPPDRSKNDASARHGDEEEPVPEVRRAASARKALPRWDISCFSAGLICANVRPSQPSGANTGSKPKPQSPAGAEVIVPVTFPSSHTSLPSG